MKNENEQKFVGDCAECVHRFDWKDPNSALKFLELILAFCKVQKVNPSDAQELFSEFLNNCEHHGLTPQQGLEILNAQDWAEEESNAA